MISVICPKSSRAIGWSCEDQQSVSHLQDFYTYQRPLMSLPTLQQGRTFTNWLRRKRIPQVRTWGDFISHQLTHKYMHTAFYLVLDLQCTLRDVPDLKLTCCVSWDQDGVFRLIWAQAQHTFTRLLWSIELAWDEEGDTEQYSYSKANTKKPISCIMSNLDQFYTPLCSCGVLQRRSIGTENLFLFRFCANFKNTVLTQMTNVLLRQIATL